MLVRRRGISMSVDQWKCESLLLVFQVLFFGFIAVKSKLNAFTENLDIGLMVSYIYLAYDTRSSANDNEPNKMSFVVSILRQGSSGYVESGRL